MKNTNLTARFRKQLKNQLPILQADGIIDTNQADAISQKYQLENIAAETTKTLLMVIYLIGAFLVGIGIISFVAYHWTAIDRPVKVAMIFAIMLLCQLAGIYLWKISAKSPKLGHALIFLGTLIFGANIGLMAQIFHIRENIFNGFGAWAAGALIMAYALGSAPNAMIAVITSFVWFFGSIGWRHDIYWWYPLVAAIAFLPFIYLRKSVFIFFLTLLCLGISVPIILASNQGDTFGATGAMLVIGVIFFCWGMLSNTTDKFRSFATPAMVIGVISASAALYLSSFLDFAEELPQDMFRFFTEDISIRIFAVIVALIGVLMLVLTLLRIKRCNSSKIILLINSKV